MLIVSKARTAEAPASASTHVLLAVVFAAVAAWQAMEPSRAMVQGFVVRFLLHYAFVSCSPLMQRGTRHWKAPAPPLLDRWNLCYALSSAVALALVSAPPIHVNPVPPTPILVIFICVATLISLICVATLISNLQVHMTSFLWETIYYCVGLV